MIREHVSITNEDLGISEDGQEHNTALTLVEDVCIKTLEKCGKGREKAIPAETLAWSIFGDMEMEQAKRNVRKLVNHLIMTHKIPVCSLAGNGGGYWLPIDISEEEAVYEARRKRAMTGLMKMAHGRKAAYVDILDQLTFGFDSPEGARAIERMNLAPKPDSMPAFVKLITRFLARMEADPQKYALEIAQLQKHFGHIFVSRQTTIELKQKSEKIQQLAGEVQALMKRIAA